MDLPTEEENRIIGFVQQDNVEDLKQYTNPLQLHSIADIHGDNLLHTAVSYQSRKVFDYLLSIDYPLELTNVQGETVLFACFYYSFLRFDAYFANRLIEKGADVSVLHDSTLLHCASADNLEAAARILIESGVDVNKPGYAGLTPLHLSARSHRRFRPNSFEIAAMLLVYGADASIRDENGNTPFDLSVIASHCNVQLQELLVLYTFDQYTEYKIRGSVLLELVKQNPSLFLQIHRNIVEVDLDDNLKYHGQDIFTMDVECLDVLVGRFPNVLRFLLKNSRFEISAHTVKPFFKSIYCISKSKIDKDLIYFVSNAESRFLANVILDEPILDLSEVTGFYCFLLSYGLHITEYDVKVIYRRFGYCELFKILLHMDIEKLENHFPSSYKYYLNAAFPKLCYNFIVDFQSLCNETSNVYHLLHYYNDPMVKEYCLNYRDDKIVNMVESMPTIPLLIELARNAFRKYFVETFGITSSRRFYTLLKALPISHVHEKIITLETELY